MSREQWEPRVGRGREAPKSQFQRTHDTTRVAAIKLQRPRTAPTGDAGGGSRDLDAARSYDEHLLTERALLAAGWRDPVGLNDAGFQVGLRPRDFLATEHGFVFCYLCRCAELGSVPTADKCVAFAAANGVIDHDLIVRSLTDDSSRSESLIDWAHQVQRDADDRLTDEMRLVARDALRALRDALSAPRSNTERSGWLSLGQRRTSRNRGPNRRRRTTRNARMSGRLTRRRGTSP